MAADVMGQVLHDAGTGSVKLSDAVANRYDPDQFAVVYHRQVTALVLGHDRQAVLDGVRFVNRDYPVRHHFLDVRRLGRPTLDHDSAQVIAVGEDADDLVVLCDDDSPHVSLEHSLNRFEYGSGRLDRNDLRALAPKNVGYGC